MQLTNRYSLPDPFVAAVRADDYERGEAEYTATELIKPSRILIYSRIHDKEMVEDVSERVWAFQGQTKHVVLERAAKTDLERYMVEHRFETVVPGVNSKISGKIDLYDKKDNTLYDFKETCLPPDTEVLTDFGWERIDTIEPGDIILSYDTATTKLKWTTVNATHVHPSPATLCEIKTRGFRVVCTSNHRWPVLSRCEYHYKRKKDGFQNHRSWHVSKFKTTSELKCCDEMIISSGVPIEDTNGHINMTEFEAELLGWLVTDGWITWMGLSPCGWLSQKKEPYLSHLRSRFRGWITKERNNKEGVAMLHLTAKKLRPLLSRIGFTSKADLPRIACSLNGAARRAMLDAMCCAEGSIGRYDFCQNPGPVWDAFLILSTLEGRRIGVTRHPKGALYGYRRRSPRLYQKRNGRRVTQIPSTCSTVHCLSTDTETFIIRQNNTVTITGNSIWKFMVGDTKEWEQQANINLYLMRVNDINVKRLINIAILKDWKAREARFGRKPDYPKCPVHVLPLPMWSIGEAQAFITERIEKHRGAATNPPVCTKAERWQRDASWAVMRTDRKRALKLYDSEDIAQAAMMQAMRAAPPGDSKKFYIEERQAEPVRCLDWCSVSEFCDFGRAANKKWEQQHLNIGNDKE